MTSLASLRRVFRLVALLLSMGLWSSLPAQSTAGSDNEDQVVKLTVYPVTAERGTGYNVSSSSSITRANTRLIEIPQPVDIVTRAFWNDRDATTMTIASPQAGILAALWRPAAGAGKLQIYRKSSPSPEVEVAR